MPFPVLNAYEKSAFVQKVWERGRRLYRDLPWRNTTDPYQILVSEVMLQQTQVSRVLKHWESFIRLFPSLDALASAQNSLVLEQWQGLGYNRRALALKRCADICSADYNGKLPPDYDSLLALPGVGKATAGGIMAFAYNRAVVYLETNVRSVFLHELFPDRDQVSDKELEPLVEELCSREDPRGWYYALLDYGAYLKEIYPNPSRRSKHYTKQSKFEGSRRQKRGEILRIVLAEESLSKHEIQAALNAFEKKAGRGEVSEDLVTSLLDDLVAEGFFTFDVANARYLSQH